jgi:hypothetical protein
MDALAVRFDERILGGAAGDDGALLAHRLGSGDATMRDALADHSEFVGVVAPVIHVFFVHRAFHLLPGAFAVLWLVGDSAPAAPEVASLDLLDRAPDDGLARSLHDELRRWRRLARERARRHDEL